MEPQARTRHTPFPTTIAEAVDAKLAQHVGGPAAANDADQATRTRSQVDPLWMIVAAMAVLFALLALLTSF